MLEGSQGSRCKRNAGVRHETEYTGRVPLSTTRQVHGRHQNCTAKETHLQRNHREAVHTPLPGWETRSRGCFPVHNAESSWARTTEAPLHQPGVDYSTHKKRRKKNEGESKMKYDNLSWHLFNTKTASRFLTRFHRINKND